MASQSTARIERHNPAGLIIGQFLFVVRIILLAVLIIVGLILHYAWRILQVISASPSPSPWPRIFLHSVSWSFGIATAAKGTRVPTNVLYASNHHSWIDIPVIAGLTGCTFVAKDTLANWPVVGFLCRINNTIFVSRENRLSISDQVDDLRKAMAGDQPVTIFPEGTTHDGSGLLPFKPSLFAALVPPPTGMMVQPVYLTYGRHTRRIAWVGKETALHSLWRLLSYVRPITATLYFLEPFDPADYPDRKAISAEVRTRISAAMERNNI